MTNKQVAPSLHIIFLARLLSALAVCSTHPSMGVFVSGNHLSMRVLCETLTTQDVLIFDIPQSMGVLVSGQETLTLNQLNAKTILLGAFLSNHFFYK